MKKSSRQRRTGRFLSPEVLDRVANMVHEAAKKQNVQAALTGGFALQFYGSPRLTGDVDFLANKPIMVGYYKNVLLIGGHRRDVDGVEVDVIVRSDEFASLYEEALEEAEWMEGVAYPIITPEYLVAMKVQARRKKDEDDVFFLLLDVELDWSKLNDIVRRHLGPHAVSLLSDLKREVEWRREKGL